MPSASTAEKLFRNHPPPRGRLALNELNTCQLRPRQLLNVTRASHSGGRARRGCINEQLDKPPTHEQINGAKRQQRDRGGFGNSDDQAVILAIVCKVVPAVLPSMSYRFAKTAPGISIV
jgi:hypothetical protein